jgi:polyhydroxyalkanoate synthesis regulator phasin
MNPDTILQIVQKGFRVTLGATAFLIETLQDPQRRDENLYRLRVDLDQLTEEWAVKGEMTEQEARNFVDTILSQRAAQANSSDAPGTSSGSSTATVAPPDVQLDLQELTAQIAAMRAELERLREQDSQS